METIKVKINPTAVSLMRKTDMECQARKEIIEYIFEKNLNIESERFKTYNKDYEEGYEDFYVLRNNLENVVIKPKIPEGKKYNWYLDYDSNILTINILN